MADDRSDYIELCRFRELFQGRFSKSESAVILQSRNGLVNAVNFVLESEPREVRQLLENERNTWTTIMRKKQRLEGSSILDKARSGKINTGARLFACAPCDILWWRRTPDRKKVSCCNRCRKRYDAVPRDKEWGWAELHCPHCNTEFRGWYAIYMKCPCPTCGQAVLPTRICPPIWNRVNRRRSFHVCAAPDCPGRNYYKGIHPQIPVDPNLTCVYPGSRLMRGLPRVVTPSTEHDSTGSTVDTFLSQSDLNKPCDEYFPALPVIPEEGPGPSAGN